MFNVILKILAFIRISHLEAEACMYQVIFLHVIPIRIYLHVIPIYIIVSW